MYYFLIDTIIYCIFRHFVYTRQPTILGCLNQICISYQGEREFLVHSCTGLFEEYEFGLNGGMQ